MAEFVELGAEGVNHLVEHYWDYGYDTLHGRNKSRSNTDSQNPNSRQRKARNQLPSPEPDRDVPDAARVDAGSRRSNRRSDSLERQSETSERITRAYENERDDPIRPVKPVFPERQRKRDSARMSYANDYQQQRPRSQGPARDRYDDDDASDYDEREGRRYRTSGRGYDDRDDRDYPYDREVVETERYKGPARPYDARRMDSFGSRAYDGPYGAGAVAPYRRSQGDLTEASRRSRSRGRRDRYDRDDRDRSYSGSRSPERGHGGGNNWREKLEDVFDTSLGGIGAGVAGAVVGGLAGRQFGHKHKQRDILVGAIVGGLGANAAENKWKEYKEGRREKLDRREEEWEQKWDGGRSRSRGR